MMVLLNLAFLALLFAVACVVVWLLWSAIALCIARKKIRAVLLGIPASALICTLIVATLYYRATRPDIIFKNEFGFAPPADTTIINARSYALGDSGSSWIEFKTSPATFNRLSSGYHPPSGTYASSDTPAWYTPSQANNVIRLANDSPNPQTAFSTEHRELIFRPSTGQAWYGFWGVD